MTLVEGGLKKESSKTTSIMDSAVISAIFPLYWKDIFLGSGVAISSTIIISAGHHFNMMRDDVADFTVFVKPSGFISAEFASKVNEADVLVLWLRSPVDAHVHLRGLLPPVDSRVGTIWLSPKPPHDPVISPGFVVSSEAKHCVAQGTVSTTGSSGAPVVDFWGDHVVGIHLSSNMKNGSRVSDFIPSRRLIFLLAEMNIACR